MYTYSLFPPFAYCRHDDTPIHKSIQQFYVPKPPNPTVAQPDQYKAVAMTGIADHEGNQQPQATGTEQIIVQTYLITKGRVHMRRP
jgi:hypothetical protein